MRSENLGGSWAGPELCAGLARRIEADGTEIVMCDVSPKWHEATQTLLATGHTVRYRDDKGPAKGIRWTAYAVFDSESGIWGPWKILHMPDGEKFKNSGAGSTQRIDLPDGTILLPVYFQTGEKNGRALYSSTVLRCEFDGRELACTGFGSVLFL